MVIFPNAKINLGLRVLEKRTDGYHNLETFFYPIPYYDVLEILPSDKDSLTHYNLDVREDNILITARDKLREIKNFDPVDIYLYKNIPIGGSLGGGSSDAAFLLKGLNELFRLQVSKNELMEVCATIGKDCPFFIKNLPSLASGTGDIFKSADVNLNGYFLVVVTPPFNVLTQEAFSWISPATTETPLADIINNSDVSGWKGNVINDFQSMIIEKFPEVKRILNLMEEAGTLYASLTGTGSSVYGIFEKEPSFDNLDRNWKVWAGTL